MIGWGTPPEIALYVQRPVRTIRNWAASGAIPSACRLSDRALVVHATEARRHSEARQTRQRLLTRAS